MSRDGRFEKINNKKKKTHKKQTQKNPTFDLSYFKLILLVVKDLLLRHLHFKLAVKQLMVERNYCSAFGSSYCYAEGWVQFRKHHTRRTDTDIHPSSFPLD